MAGFNITKICIQGTRGIEPSCLDLVDGVHSQLSHLEVAVSTVAVGLILWKFTYLMREYLELRKGTKNRYIKLESEEPMDQPQVSANSLVNWKRVDQFAVTVAFLFLAAQFILIYDAGRRNVDDKRCEQLNYQAIKLCKQLLNATYQGVFPSNDDGNRLRHLLFDSE